MISESVFKQIIAEAAYEGAKKALAEVGSRHEEPYEPKAYLSKEEAIAFLDKKGVPMSLGHLKNLRCRGEIPAFIINNKLRFLQSDLELWLTHNVKSDLQSLENAERVLAESAWRK